MKKKKCLFTSIIISYTSFLSCTQLFSWRLPLLLIVPYFCQLYFLQTTHNTAAAGAVLAAVITFRQGRRCLSWWRLSRLWRSGCMWCLIVCQWWWFDVAERLLTVMRGTENDRVAGFSQGWMEWKWENRKEPGEIIEKIYFLGLNYYTKNGLENILN